MRRISLLALAFAAACSSIGGGDDNPGADAGSGGDGGAPDDQTCATRSGSRLQQVLREAADGSQEHLHFQDTELDTPCTFASASDGSIRCLPLSGGRFLRASAIYTDSQCGDAIAEIDKEQPTSDLMELRRTDGCGRVAEATYHQVGGDAGVTEGQQIYVRSRFAGCVAAQDAELARYDYRTIGQDFSLDGFVAASETMIGDGRLRVPRLDGADGSSECRAGRPLRDQDRGGAACEPTVAEDGARRCLPLGSGPYIDGIFTDADCGASIDAAVVDRTCEPDATVIREYVDAACGAVTRVRAMGAPLDQLYWTEPGTCGPVPDDFETFRIGQAVAPDGFAALIASETPAGDRLLALDLTADGVRFPSGMWRDPTMGADCSFREAADGATRCLPTPTLESPQAQLSTVSTLTYADAACSTPMMVATLSHPTACGGAAPTYAVEWIGTIEGIPDGSVFQLGELITDPVYRMAGSCALYSPGVDLYAVGPVVPPGSFVRALD